MKLSSTRRIGAHLSVAQGLIHAAQEMIEKGGNCLQVFSASPRVWARKPLDAFPFEEYKKFCTEHDFGPTIVHAMYLVNLATDNPDLLKKSIDVLKYDLRFSSHLGAMGVVVHPGSHQGRGFEQTRAQVSSAIVEILKDTPEDSMFLLENAAQKGKIGADLHEIRAYLDDVTAAGFGKRLGWCYDTCHGFCSGYELSALEHKITELQLWDSLRAVHLNDARDPLGSGRDRHENLGKGEMSLKTLETFLQHPKFKHLPLFMEVPGFDGEGPDAKNVSIAKQLCGLV